MDSWEVQIEYEISGGGARGADGMAFWYTAEGKHEGIAMGSKEEFKGLAVFLDTFDNDGQVQLWWLSMGYQAIFFSSFKKSALSLAGRQPQNLFMG